MPGYGSSIQTAQIPVNGIANGYDKFDSTQLNNAARNPLGGAYYDVANVTASLPQGTWAKYRYVRYNSTTNPALIARPSIVYYTDKFKTVVSPTLADGFTATAADVAGIMLITTASISGLTAAILNGNFVWIQVGGVCLGVNAPGSTAVGDFLIGASGNQTLARIAQNGTVTANPIVGYALTAVSSNASDMFLTLEY